MYLGNNCKNLPFSRNNRHIYCKKEVTFLPFSEYIYRDAYNKKDFFKNCY